MIGIDKTIIKGFRIELLDKEMLLNNNNVILQERPHGIYAKNTDGSETLIDYLKIVDGDMFNNLIMGVKKNKGIYIAYSMIELSVAEKMDNNLRPLSISEYHNRIERLFRYLENRYGLYMDISELYFDDMEINITAEMDRQFIEYEFLLDNMVYLVPKKYDISPYLGKDRTVKQYKFFNNTVEGKVYDKTRQLKEKFKIEGEMQEQYIRIEYTLHGSRKIESALGTRYVSEMTDSAIEEYLHVMIAKDLIKPIQKHIETANKKLLTMAKGLKEKDSRRWIGTFFREAVAEVEDKRSGKLPLVIDMEQITGIIKKVSSSTNYAKTLERLADNMNRHLYLSHNLDKLNEIINKFTLI